MFVSARQRLLPVPLPGRQALTLANAGLHHLVGVDSACPAVHLGAQVTSTVGELIVAGVENIVADEPPEPPEPSG
jgi:hypothetical protein